MFGGIVRSSGPDKNGNGVLDPDEVEQTRALCNPTPPPRPPPAPPPPTLLRMDPEPPGPNCFHGGTVVRSGPDRNRNGVLDDVEIVMTTYVCTVSELFEGNFTAAMWHDPAAVLALGQARVVTGSVTIDSDAAVSLPMLELVGGSVTLVHAGTPAGFSAPALAHIGGDLVVNGAGFSSELVLPALARVGGLLTLTDTTLPGFRAPSLAEVSGTLAVNGAALATLDLSALRVAGDLRLVNLAVTAVELPALTTVLGDLSLTQLHALTLLDASALRSVGWLELGDLPLLGAIDLPLLAEARELSVYAVGAHTLRLPALIVVEGDMSILNSAALEGLTLPALVTIGGRFGLDWCPVLENVEAPVLDSVGELGTSGDFSIFFAVSDLRGLILPRLRSAPGGLTLEGVRLSLLDLPALTNAPRVRLSGNLHLVAMRMPALPSVDWVSINSPALQELALDALATVSLNLAVRNTRLVDLRGLHNLRAIGDGPGSLASLYIGSNPELTSLAGLEQLAAISGGFGLADNAKLASLAALASLRSVGGAVTVTGDPALSPDEIAALIARVHP
jgi:hypothetical protein